MTYPRPSLTADVAVITFDPAAAALRLLLIERARPPFAQAWALPGGFCEPGETVEAAAARELQEETHVAGLHLEQLGVFSAPGRDPRGWVVSVAYLAVVPADTLPAATAGDDAAAARWWDLRVTPGTEGFTLASGASTPGALAFDHSEIVGAALGRLKEKVDRLALRLLPRRFTLAEATAAFRAVLGDVPAPEALGAWLVETGRVRLASHGVDRYEVAPAAVARYPWGRRTRDARAPLGEP